MGDDLDRKILRALQHAPRASFRRIGEVLGVSEQTAARHYQGLRRSGVLRVVGLVDPAVYGQAEWIARIRCRPDRVTPLAEALARRREVSYATLASGGSEIICILRSPADSDRDDILLKQVPRASSVLDVSIDLMLHEFGTPATAYWTAYTGRLDPAQIERLAGPPRAVPDGPPTPPNSEDTPLLDALADDGRATQTRLAELTGWSNARVGRRLEALEASGTLTYSVEILPESLGYHLYATLWLRVAPARLQQVGDELAAHPEVAFAGAISGDNNLIVIVNCLDTDDFYRYLTTRVAAVPGIDGYSVSIRVRRLKQAASLIAQGRLIRA